MINREKTRSQRIVNVPFQEKNRNTDVTFTDIDKSIVNSFLYQPFYKSIVMNIYAYLFLVAVSIGGIAALSAPGSPVAAPRKLRAAEAMWTHFIVVISSAPSDGLYLYGKCTSTCEHAVTCRQIKSSNSCYTELYIYIYTCT